MRVVLDRSLFGTNQNHELFLSDLVGTVLRCGHRLGTRPEWGTQEATDLLTGWALGKSREHYRRMVTALNMQPAPWTGGSQELQLVVTASSSSSLPPKGRRLEMPATDEVIRFVERPLLVLLEDKQDDWNFLILCVDSDWADWLKKAVDGGWIKPNHGGGLGSIKRFVQQILVDPRERLRHFVLTDSDRPCAGDLMDEAYEIQKACKDALPHHALDRRAIENYVPDAALERWAAGAPERLAWLADFRRLTDTQRHHFKLKQGAEGGLARHGHHTHPSVQRLYGPLLTDSAHPLQKGPPGDLGALWSSGVRPSDLLPDSAAAERRKIYRAIFEAI
ncbi:MAG TPA: hypothetical protein PKY30_05635 [Myxococcota bacterium]|nr:hypothetical protein [Myxococcota bacterium]